MKKLLTILILVSFSNSFGQDIDTIWLNKNWQIVNKKDADYFRITSYNTDNQKYYVRDYYRDGRVQMTGRYKSLNPEIKDGVFINYFDSTKIEERFIDDKLYRRIEWSLEGSLLKDESNGYKEVKNYNGNEPYYEVEVLDVEPNFNRGKSSLLEYLRDNFKYPDYAYKKKIQGRVVIQFTIDKKGKMDNISVLESDSVHLNQRALELVKNMPRWSPGVLNGEIVISAMKVPIYFRIR